MIEIVLIIIGIIMCFIIPVLLVLCIYRKKKGVIFSLLVFEAIIVYVMLFKIDFIKKRKQVDVNWLYGKTINQINFRYYRPQSDEMKEDYNGCQLCTYEILYWDPMDGIYDMKYFYVHLDGDGCVEKVETIGSGNNEYGEKYNYWDRWGL